MNALGNSRKKTGRIAAALCSAFVAVGMLLAVSPASAATNPAPGSVSSPAEASGKVDVNAASATELASLPGIGASKAAAIIAEREKKPFASVDDLERVRGIGARTVEDLRGKVAVGSH